MFVIFFTNTVCFISLLPTGAEINAEDNPDVRVNDIVGGISKVSTMASIPWSEKLAFQHRLCVDLDADPIGAIPLSDPITNYASQSEANSITACTRGDTCTTLTVAQPSESVGAMNSQVAISHHSNGVDPQTSVVVFDPVNSEFISTVKMKVSPTESLEEATARIFLVGSVFASKAELSQIITIFGESWGFRINNKHRVIC